MKSFIYFNLISQKERLGLQRIYLFTPIHSLPISIKHLQLPLNPLLLSPLIFQSHFHLTGQEVRSELHIFLSTSSIKLPLYFSYLFYKPSLIYQSYSLFFYLIFISKLISLLLFYLLPSIFFSPKSVLSFPVPGFTPSSSSP